MATIDISEKSRLVAWLLSRPPVLFGAHRFYAGKAGSGIAKLLTLGGLGMWTMADSFVILFCAFTDKHGRRIAMRLPIAKDAIK